MRLSHPRGQPGESTDERCGTFLCCGFRSPAAGNPAPPHGVVLCSRQRLTAWSCVHDRTTTMSDPLRGTPGSNPPPHLRPDGDDRSIGWTLGAVAAVAMLGVSYWAWSEHAPVPAPAITAAPAPVTGVPASPPETTT